MTEEISSIGPHLKVHEIVAAFAGKEHAADGRDLFEREWEIGEQRVIDGLGRNGSQVVPMLERVKIADGDRLQRYTERIGKRRGILRVAIGAQVLMRDGERAQHH